MTRRTMYLVVLALILIPLTSSAWAHGGGGSIDITGNFFNPKPGMTRLCADVCPSEPWEIIFCGETPYELQVKAGPICTNSIGKICLNAIWPQGVYKVKAYTIRDQQLVEGRSRRNKCEAVAVSVFNPNNFCGAQGGGALNLFSYDVPPSVKKTLEPRQATFAYIFKQSVPQNYGVWYFDNCNPCGDVEFVAKSFTDIFYDTINGPVMYNTLNVRGNGWLKGKRCWIPVHYLLYADDYPGDSWFRLQLWDFTGRLLYQSSPENSDSEKVVVNGKNTIEECL